MFDTDVLIIGAGPVGLSLAIELGMQGRSCIVVERHDRVGLAPRAKTTNVRSRELMRRWRIADRLADASPFGVAYPSNIVFATRLGGRELARFSNAFYCAPARDERFAEHAQWIPQYKVEEVLRARAVEFPGVDIRFGMALDDWTDIGAGVAGGVSEGSGARAGSGAGEASGAGAGRGVGEGNGVAARVTDVVNGTTSTIRARYLVGADGARSTVRAKLGIPMEGRAALSRHHNIIFRAPDLADRHRLGPAVMYWLVNSEVPAVVAPLDSDGRWTFGCPRLDDTVSDPAALIRAALALDGDIDIDIVSRDEWTAHQLIATHYREGNVFLAGDACHLHPPFGGHGMNMGVGDAVDLGWKLSAVLNGWGGDALLDSYEIERRPVHRRVVDEAVLNLTHTSHKLVLDGIEDSGAAGDAARAEAAAQILATKQREFDSLGVVLGTSYGASPILADEATQAAVQESTCFVPTARAGSRAPHAWLADGNAFGASLFDRLATCGFTLLVTDGAGDRTDARANDEAAAIASAVSGRGIPLQSLTPQNESLRALYEARYALIRPDQHVAWRGDDLRDLTATLARAAGHVHSKTKETP